MVEGYTELINELYIPKIIQESFDELTDEDVEGIRDHTVLTLATQGEEITMDDSGNKIIRLAGKFDVNVNELEINLIKEINPFQRAYEVISHSLTTEVLRTIQYTIDEQREGKMSLEEATFWMFEYLPKWREDNPGKLAPELTDGNPVARDIARAIEIVKRHKQQLLDREYV